jgi:hypothetical protein
MNISTIQGGWLRPAGKVSAAIAAALALAGLGMTPAYADEHGDRGHERHHAHHYVARPAYYAPAPVYYAPQPSPGVSLFVPIVIR